MSEKLLNFIGFSSLFSWSVKYLSNKKISYNNNFEFVSLSRILKRNKTSVDVQDSQKYKRVTIKINNGGVFLRDEQLGKEIGTKKQFLIKDNQFILSKIDARNGAFGIATKDVDNAIITGNFWAYDVDYSLIDPVYLSLITTTKEFTRFCQKSSAGTTNRHYLQEELFLAEKIPLPPLPTQQKLVSNYQNKMAKAARLEATAENLNCEIERYLFEQLGIEIRQTKKAKVGKLKFLNLTELTSWGVARQEAVTAETIFCSKQFKNVSITHFFYINPTSNPPKDKEISFIPMTNVSDEYGEIMAQEKQLIKSGYTKFQENDLIWARITPCMENGKSAVAKNLSNGFGFGSTEFHVLRNRNNEFDIHLLHLLLRSQYLCQIAKQYFTGSAGQQRVPKSFLEALTLPILKISKQQEIVCHIQAQKQTQKSAIEQAAVLREKALREFEAEIFV